jgi:hypothetical protein
MSFREAGGLKKIAWLLLACGLCLAALTNLGLLSSGQPYIYQIQAELPPQSPRAAFVDVTVIPMDGERMLEHQTVLISSGVIERIGPYDQVELPPGVLILDGRGKYLMPGLVDMHVHIEYPNDLLLLVANGVTSVRNLWGNTGKKLIFGLPDQLELKRQIEAGTLFGPTIYTRPGDGGQSGKPSADGVLLPAEAAQSVAQKRWGMTS